MNKPPKVGARTFKTALAIFCCIITLTFLKRDGVVFACIAAMLCMQPTIKSSVEIGTHRLIGTFFGVLLGFAFALLSSMFLEPNIFRYALITSIGIIVLIYLLNLLKLTQCISIACVTYLIILLNIGIDSCLTYSINRIIDTLLGVVIGVFINAYVLVPKNKKKRS